MSEVTTLNTFRPHIKTFDIAERIARNEYLGRHEKATILPPRPEVAFRSGFWAGWQACLSGEPLNLVADTLQVALYEESGEEIEIRLLNKRGKIFGSMVFGVNEARGLARIIVKFCDQVEAEQPAPPRAPDQGERG